MRTRKTVFVLISGKAGTGKSTLATYLANHLGNNLKGISVVVDAFANPIKQLALNYFGWDRKKDERGRRLLQVLGTECGRAYDENIWVKKILDSVNDLNLYPPNFVIIDDWRFPNECSYIMNQHFYDVVTIRVEASTRELLKGTPEENHPSEVSLPSGNSPGTSQLHIYNYIVDNNHSFEQLYSQADKIILSLAERFILE